MDTVCRKIYELSQQGDESIWLYKEDMDRAFRQLLGDYSSVPLLGFRWRGRYYFDLVMMMGCRIAPYICQRVTSMIVYLHRKNGYYLTNYVDDFLGLERVSMVHQAHQALIVLLSEVGASRSERKSVSPTQEIEFVGNLLNTVSMTIGVTPTRRVELLRELETWHYRVVTTCRQLESLVGKLQFLSACIRPGRLFTSRLIQELRGMKRGSYYRVSEEARKDIKWWYLFLPNFEGSSLMWLIDVEKVDAEMSVDACLHGAGGVRKDQCFTVTFPQHISGNKKYSISHYELWAVIVAIRIWWSQLTGKIIRVRTDNEAVAVIVNTGCARSSSVTSTAQGAGVVVSYIQCKGQVSTSARGQK